MLLLFCLVIVDPIFCDRPFILWAFFCLMTLAHIVGADVTETNKWPCLTIMLFTGDHSLGTRKTQTLFKDTNIILFLQSHLQVDSLILWFDLRDRTFFFSTFCGVFKVFITNLPSTCWLPRISGQFCDGSFSKSVINTKTALTRLSIQNNLFCRATFIIMAYYWIGTYKNSFWKINLYFKLACSQLRWYFLTYFSLGSINWCYGIARAFKDCIASSSHHLCSWKAILQEVATNQNLLSTSSNNCTIDALSYK